MGFQSGKIDNGPLVRHGGKPARQQAKRESVQTGNQVKHGPNNKGTGSLAGQPKAMQRKVVGSSSVNPDGVLSHKKSRFWS